MFSAEALLKLVQLISSFRMAIRLIFGSFGILQACVFLLPLLQAWLHVSGESAFKYASELSFGLSVVVGTCLGLICFDSICWLLTWVEKKRKIYLVAQANFKQASLIAHNAYKAEIEFIQGFKSIYSVLDAKYVLILHTLDRGPKVFYAREDGIHYLSTKKWIRPTQDLPKDYFLYQLDSRISAALKEIEMDEIDFKSSTFLESEKFGCRQICEILISNESDQHINSMTLKEWSESFVFIKQCFWVHPSKDSAVITFLRGYHACFEKKLQKKLPSQISFSFTKEDKPNSE